MDILDLNLLESKSLFILVMFSFYLNHFGHQGWE
jgi:hypothetical protein